MYGDLREQGKEGKVWDIWEGKKWVRTRWEGVDIGRG